VQLRENYLVVGNKKTKKRLFFWLNQHYLITKPIFLFNVFRDINFAFISTYFVYYNKSNWWERIIPKHNSNNQNSPPKLKSSLQFRDGINHNINLKMSHYYYKYHGENGLLFSLTTSKQSIIKRSINCTLPQF